MEDVNGMFGVVVDLAGEPLQVFAELPRQKWPHGIDQSTNRKHLLGYLIQETQKGDALE